MSTSIGTLAWHKKKEAIYEKIAANPALKPEYKYLAQQMVEFTLPEYDGGTWKKELHPGIYEPRRYDMEKHVKRYGITRVTLRGMLAKLEQAGVIERSWKKGYDNQNLVYVNAGPLLKRIERVTFPKSSPEEGGMDKIYPLSITYCKEYINSSTTISLEELCQRRIGYDRRVYKSGWVVGGAKYYYDKTADFLIDRYLKGYRKDQYASHPLLPDGMTYQLDFDVEKSYIDRFHETIQRQTAFVAHLSSIYYQRSIGRGHLVFAFSEPVNAEDAYYTITQAAPALRDCKEVYPVGRHRYGKISWPFYHIRNNRVVESRLDACFAGEYVTLTGCAGITSDRAMTETFVNLSLNSPSLIQPRPVRTSIQRKPIIPHDNTEDALQAATASADLYNATHTVPELLGAEIGEFVLSLVNEEDTPSLHIDSNIRATDYSDGGCVHYTAYDIARLLKLI